MLARAREREQVVDGRRHVDDGRLGGPPRPIATTTTSRALREQAGDVTGDGGLPDPLPGADHGERGLREGREGDRVEAEVGADVGKPRGERAARRAGSACRGSTTGSSERSTTTSASTVGEAVLERRPQSGTP